MKTIQIINGSKLLRTLREPCTGNTTTVKLRTGFQFAAETEGFTRGYEGPAFQSQNSGWRSGVMESYPRLVNRACMVRTVQIFGRVQTATDATRALGADHGGSIE